MPNEINIDGISIQTRDEVVAEILDGANGVPGLRQIYGADINVDPNTPDGNMVQIYAQGKIDVLEMGQQIYDSFDPDQAVGRSLDQRAAINGVTREAGTHTQQSITVTVTQALTLKGQDTDSPFIVSDGSGNQFALIDSHVFSGAGSASLAFQAVLLGAIVTTPNTITNIVTIQLGVASVNNPSAASSVGTNEETDYSLRVRRQNSVALPSQGFLNGLYGGLLDVSGVTAAIVLENFTNSTNADGIPAHYIWCIVQGGTNADIAEVIYRKRNAGCGMKGATDVTIVQLDLSDFVVSFDRPTAENLWISFDVDSVSGGTVDEDYLRAQLLAQLSYNVNQKADTTAILALIRSINPDAYAFNEGVSTDNVYYYPIVTPTAKNYQFEIASARIIINGSPG